MTTDKTHTETATKRCAKCGACTVVCPVFNASGGKEFYSGRGKKHLLDVMGEEALSPIFEDIFSKCLLCGACVSACPRDVDIPQEVRDARATFHNVYGEHGYQKFLAKKVLEQPELLGIARKFGQTFSRLLEDKIPADSGLRIRLAMFDHMPSILPVNASSREKNGTKSNLVFFPGCSGLYLYPEIVASCKQLLGSLGYNPVIPEGLVCCGLAMDSTGDTEASKKLAKTNIERLELHDGPIMVSCGSCFSHLRRYIEVLADNLSWRERAERVSQRLVEMSQFLDECMPESHVYGDDEAYQKTINVFYHDPCHLRYGENITREPRNILKRFSSVQLLELEDGPQCCGQGGLFHIGAPELSAVIRDDLAGKVLAMHPHVITSSCSGCLMQWKTALAATGQDIPVLHLAELLVRLQNGQPFS